MRTTTSSSEVNRAGKAAIGSDTRSKKEARMIAYTCAKPLAVARIPSLPLVSARRQFDLAIACDSLENFITSERLAQAYALVCVLST